VVAASAKSLVFELMKTRTGANPAR
jgi:hypothetical protein